MGESIFCEDCGKTLMQAKGEYDHGCLDCAGSIQSEKLFWLRKEVKVLKSKIQLQDQRVENLLKAVDFYASKDSWRDLIAEEGGPSCLISEGACDCIIAEDLSFNEEFGGETARQALARDKELTREK
jgi:hypothetical protein